MLSVKRHFLLRRISKYLRKNLVVDPALSSASSARFPRDYLDIMRLNDDSCDDEFYADELCDDEFCDEVPSSTQFSDESPFCPQTESSAPSQKPRRHSASKGESSGISFPAPAILTAYAVMLTLTMPASASHNA